VSLISWRLVSLPLEYMPQVSPTGSTGDLNAGHAQRRVFMTGYGTGDGVVEGWPAAAAVKLGIALVEWGVTSCAGVYACGLVVLVLSRPRTLGALLAEHSELLWGEDRTPFFVRLGLAIIGHCADRERADRDRC